MRKSQKRGKRDREVTERAIENYRKYVYMSVGESACARLRERARARASEREREHTRVRDTS